MNKNEKKNKITYQLSLSHLYYNDCSDEEFLEDQETLEELQEEEKEIAKKELEQKKVAIKQQIACKREELAKRKEILAAGEHLLQTASSTSSLPSGAHCANQDLLGLSRRDFLVWRRSHPGPKSKWAFRVWARNGGRDLANFKYKPPGGRRDGRGFRNIIINNYTYTYQ